jgi:ATP/ADP translocase
MDKDDVVSESPNSMKKTRNETGKEAEDHEFPELNFKEVVRDMEVTKYIATEKTRIIRYASAIIGGMFLLSGFILLYTAATRVVDNVIFGERAMFSSFLILIGMLILITVFGRRYWHDTVLTKLNVGMEISEGKSKSKDKDKITKKDNIEEENKK